MESVSYDVAKDAVQQLAQEHAQDLKMKLEKSERLHKDELVSKDEEWGQKLVQQKQQDQETHALECEGLRCKLREQEERHKQEMQSHIQKNDDLNLERYQRKNEYETALKVKDLEYEEELKKKEDSHQETIQTHEETIQRLLAQIAELNETSTKSQDSHTSVFKRMPLNFKMPEMRRSSGAHTRSPSQKASEERAERAER